MAASEGPVPGPGARRRASLRIGASFSVAWDAAMPALNTAAAAAANGPAPKRMYSW